MKFVLSKIAEITNCKLIGNPDHLITNVADLESACNTDASFLANERYQQAMRSSQAGVIFVDREELCIEGKNFLISDNPSSAFQTLLETFVSVQKYTGFTGIHSTSVVHETAKLGNAVTVSPHAIIDEDVVIGDNSFIGPFVYIGPKTVIGKNCHLHAHSVVRERCTLKDRVILQSGAVIGSCGFGYTNDQRGCFHKLQQTGTVTLEDDVEIGANTTIDRARFKTTLIQRGTKIDNLVQIAHGVDLGPNNCIVAQAGIAGSTSTGKNVIFAAQSGSIGHIKIGNGVVVAARGGVTKSLPQAGQYAGMPCKPLKEHNKQQVSLRKISKYVEEIKQLKHRLENLEKNLS